MHARTIPEARKAGELCKALKELGDCLSRNYTGNLLVWVIDGRLACAHRPLRYHPLYGGSGRDLSREATFALLQWIQYMKDVGIKSIISFLHPKELRHYAALDIGATDLIDLYRKSGFEVRHLPWEDPAHRLPSARSPFREEKMRIQEAALLAFDELSKPVLLHCSAGSDRSSPVAAHIWAKRTKPS